MSKYITRLALAMLLTSVLHAMDPQPVSFSYNYKSGPLPGLRKFERKGDLWIETGPGGNTARFRITDSKCHVYAGDGDASNPDNVRIGTCLVRINDPNYHLFIPDYGTRGYRELWFHKPTTPAVKSINGLWRVLIIMRNYCGYFDSYEKLTCE